MLIFQICTPDYRDYMVLICLFSFMGESAWLRVQTIQTRSNWTQIWLESTGKTQESFVSILDRIYFTVHHRNRAKILHRSTCNFLFQTIHDFINKNYNDFNRKHDSIQKLYSPIKENQYQIYAVQ